MTPNDVSEVAGGFAGSMLVAVLVVLGIAALVMPLYVIAIHGELKRLRKAQEEALWLAKKAPSEGMKPSSYLPPQEGFDGPPKVRMRSNG